MITGNAAREQDWCGDFTYPGSSALFPGLCQLSLSCGESAPFFTGDFLGSRNAALALMVIGKVPRSRFHLPAAMLQRLIALSDPVFTCDGQSLLFETFSGCCSTYAALRFHRDAFGEETRWNRGTSNVDFGEEFRSALAGVRQGDPLHCEAGTKELKLAVAGSSVIERKVKLPKRWTAAFNTLQCLLPELRQAGQFSAAATRQFLAALPRRSGSQNAFFISGSGAQVRVSALPSDGALELRSPERLFLIESLLPAIDKMSLWISGTGAGSAWCFSGAGFDLTLVLSPAAWRGFSGEGASLQALAHPPPPEILNEFLAALSWEDSLDAAEISRRWRLDAVQAQSLLAHGAHQGILGYDLPAGRYFHRRLPWSFAAEIKAPRLRKAKELVAAAAVDFNDRHPAAAAAVQDGKSRHQVFLEPESRCTCTHYAKHGLSRGPCSHLLAVELARKTQEPR